MRYRSTVFEAFQDNRPSRRARVVPIVLALVALAAAVALIGYLYRGRPRGEPPGVNDLVAAAPSVSSGAPAWPARLELPGMSLEAPGYATVTGDYMTGSVQSTYPIEWAVTWQHGPLPPPDALQQVVNGMIRMLETRELSTARITGSHESPVGGSPGRMFELANERGFVFVVAFGECGGRVVQIISGGPVNAKQTTTAMVDSFRCEPDASHDLDREAVAVDARPGWQRTAATGMPMLVNAREILVRPTLVPGAEAGPLDQLLPIAIRSAGFTIDSDAPQERAGRKLWFGSLALSDKRRPAAFVAWRCADDTRVAAIYIVSMQGAPLDEGIALALTGRCLGPDEKAPDYPVKGAKKK
jgi:hypothetical protein